MPSCICRLEVSPSRVCFIFWFSPMWLWCTDRSIAQHLTTHNNIVSLYHPSHKKYSIVQQVQHSSMISYMSDRITMRCVVLCCVMCLPVTPWVMMPPQCVHTVHSHRYTNLSSAHGSGGYSCASASSRPLIALLHLDINSQSSTSPSPIEIKTRIHITVDTQVVTSSVTHATNDARNDRPKRCPRWSSCASSWTTFDVLHRSIS